MHMLCPLTSYIQFESQIFLMSKIYLYGLFVNCNRYHLLPPLFLLRNTTHLDFFTCRPTHKINNLYCICITITWRDEMKVMVKAFRVIGRPPGLGSGYHIETADKIKEVSKSEELLQLPHWEQWQLPLSFWMALVPMTYPSLKVYMMFVKAVWDQPYIIDMLAESCRHWIFPLCKTEGALTRPYSMISYNISSEFVWCCMAPLRISRLSKWVVRAIFTSQQCTIVQRTVVNVDGRI